jgi:hypothetical protein
MTLKVNYSGNSNYTVKVNLPQNFKVNYSQSTLSGISTSIYIRIDNP